MIEPRLGDTVNPRLFCLLSATAGIVFGLMSYVSLVIFLPLCMAAFALLFLYEPRGRRLISYIAPLLLIVACALLYPVYLPLAVIAPLSALLIVWFYKSGRPKFDVAIYVMGLFLLAELLVLWITAAGEIGSWRPADTVAYYTDLIAATKAELTANMQQILSNYMATDTLSGEYLLDIQSLVDTFVSLVFSLYAVLAFFVAGLCFKVFGAVVRRADADRGAAVMRWHFTTPHIFAYFYIVLFFLYMFFAGGEGVFSVTVNNLYITFMVIFAYIGWKYLRFMLARSPRLRRYRVVMIVAAVLFFTLAIQMLAIEGVIAVITAHRMQRNRNSGEP